MESILVIMGKFLIALITYVPLEIHQGGVARGNLLRQSASTIHRHHNNPAPSTFIKTKPSIRHLHIISLLSSIPTGIRCVSFLCR